MCFIVSLDFSLISHASKPNISFAFAGLPMSLSSTSNSLKSNGTFNSNSSINSTPSVDRYAALKDLDEQLREIKEKDTLNTQSSSPANPFNPFHAAQAQSTTVTNGWINDQSQQQQQFNVANGNIGTISPNLYASSPAYSMNGGGQFIANGIHQPHQKLSSNGMYNNGMGLQNGYAQKNPFAVSFLFCHF